MGQRELQAGSLHADAVAIGDGLDLRNLGEDGRRGRRVLEVRAADQGARAVGAAHDDAQAALADPRHHALQRALMVQQGVAAGQQKAVGARPLQVQQQLDRLDPVDAQAPGLDDALVAQPVQGLEGALACALEHAEPFIAVEILGHVVDPDDVQVVGLQALQAVLDRAQGRVGRVVVDDLVRASMLEDLALLAVVARADVLELIEHQAADLGADDVVLARPVGQGLAHAQLGQAGAVEGRVVEVADAVVPGRGHGGARLGLGDVAEHIAERRGAEAEPAGQKVFEGHGGLLAVWDEDRPIRRRATA
eukprot:Opistho-1_new@106586